MRWTPTYGWNGRTARHARALLAHATPAKLANVLRVERESHSGAVRLTGMPYVYFVDVCNHCNLHCPLCPSASETFGRRRGMMRLAEYRRVLDQIAPWALEIDLHNWGEPFLNPDIFAIIEATRSRNVMPNLSSNLNSLTEDRAEDVVRSGLEYLVASIDGTTPEVYERYRVGGDLERVLGTLRAIVAAKRRLHSGTPLIEWQFLVMSHNEHQVEDARRLGAGIDVDFVRFAPAGPPFDRLADPDALRDWLPEDERYRHYDPARLQRDGAFERGRCRFLYRSMAIGPGGAVAPCCAVHAESDDVGFLGEDGLEAVWNNDAYLSARGRFVGAGDGRGTPCARCPIFAPARARVVQEVGA